MFFISKRKMNKIMKQYDDEKMELINQINKLNEEKVELDLRLQEGSYIQNTKLLEQNNKLIEWIQKILQEVGTCRVNNMNTFTIPIMYREKMTYNSNDFPLKKEYIDIPSIQIIKVSPYHSKRLEEYLNKE